MPDSASDPRPIWRLNRRLQRFLPRWLLFGLFSVLRSLLFVFFRDYLNSLAPVHKGVHIWTEGPNSDLYLERVKLALDVISTSGPIYVRWLGRRSNAVVVSQLFMIMPSMMTVDVRRRIITLRPQTVWKESAEQLALYLVGGATRSRLGRRFAVRMSAVRGDRRVL